MLGPERAEDAVQGALLSAYRALRSSDEQIRLRPWLFRVAHTAAIDALRQRAWRHEPIDEDNEGAESRRPGGRARRAPSAPPGERRARARGR